MNKKSKDRKIKKTLKNLKERYILLKAKTKKMLEFN
jgi:hypothetical protein